MKKTIINSCILTAVIACLHLGSHKVRKYSQHHKFLNEALVVCDGLDFFAGGGGSLYYSNFFTWSYTHALKDHPRTLFSRVMFWDFYPDHPPKQYEYKLL